MLFHSFPFYVFLAVVFSVYWLLPRLMQGLARLRIPAPPKAQRAQMLWLLVASCVFYMSWNPWFILLIGVSATIDYFVAIHLPAARTPARRRLLLSISLTTNLGALAFFKYTNFLLGTAHWMSGWIGIDYDQPIYHILVPLGISFYTFEAISYVVDVYRGRIAPARNLIDYALFIMFFPHLIAGPIVRPNYFLPQARRRKRLSWARVELGFRFFLMGLIKKAIIADHLGQIIDPVFADPSQYGSGAAWLATFSYAIQIYCDFSGYSDMAIGTGHMLGFKLPLNFRMPHFSASIAEFWQRWHITLTTWLRDYVALPLRRRYGREKGHLITLATMLLVGLWHGSSWTFVVWGLYNGLLLVLQRVLPMPGLLALPAFRPLRVAFTFVCVSVGGIFFRSQSFSAAGLMFERLFRPTAGLTLSSPEVAVITVLILVVFVCHLVATLVDVERVLRRSPAPVLGIGMACALLLVQLLLPLENKVFIYFQF